MLFRSAREAAGLDLESVRNLIMAEFDGRTNPRQLSSSDCDRLVELIEGLASSQTAQRA